MPALRASKRAAFAYLSVALTIPFMMPIKHTINKKDHEEICYGYFGVGNAFRI